MVTKEESLEILKRHLKDDVIDMKNHRLAQELFAENTYKFTIRMMSLELLIGIMEEEKVKNVFFHPAMPPPGGGVDSISLRYKVYVEYHSEQQD